MKITINVALNETELLSWANFHYRGSEAWDTAAIAKAVKQALRKL